MTNEAKQRSAQACKTPDGWQIEMDDASWAELMTGLSIAIDKVDPEWAARLRKLRSALSQG